MALEPRRRRFARLARLRRSACVLVIPGLSLLALDVARRARFLASLRGWEVGQYLATTAGAVGLWALLLYVGAARRGRFRAPGAAVFVVLYAFSLAVQQAFFSRYRVYVNIDPLIFGDDLLRGVVATLPLGRSLVLPVLAVAAAAAIVQIWLARRVLRPKHSLRRVAPAFATIAVVAACVLPVSPPVSRQAAAPEVMYLHATTVFVNDRLRRRFRNVKPQIVRVQRRDPVEVPPLLAQPPTLRNVVLLLQEAQRADATCIAYDPGCTRATRATNLLTPQRLPFHQVRAATSSTAVAIAVLWSGLDPTETYGRLHSAPLVWDFAHRAGYDTAYWTSQNLMFGNSRLWVQDVPLSQFVSGTDLDPHADWLTGASDQLLVDHVLATLPKLAEPFFAVVHFSNIHRPRVIDRSRVVFQPTNFSDEGPGGPPARNYYLNSVYASDLAVARLIEQLRATDAGKRTVLLYTADHGEAHGEHKNENDHSSTVYDEEIRVPQWIDAPRGVLSDAEVAGYRKNEHALITQYDQAATLLDLLGLWDAPGLGPFRERMLGTPIARTLVQRPVPLTNVSWVWEYHRPNWGMMHGSLKVLAQIEDPRYLCFDVLEDPREKHELGPERCAGLIAEADRTYGMLPRDMRRLRDRPDFGRSGERGAAGR